LQLIATDESCSNLGRAYLRRRAKKMKSDVRYSESVLREAERELDAATTRTALDAAAKKFMRAKAELKRLQAEVSA
jgi:hypothetical protein